MSARRRHGISIAFGMDTSLHNRTGTGKQAWGNVTNGDFVNRLYQNVLGRPAEAAGYAYWMNELARGVSRADVLVGFSESPENVNAVAPTIANGIWLSD